MSYYTNLLDMSFSLLLHFLPVLYLETSVSSILKFCPVLCGRNDYKIVFFAILLKPIWICELTAYEPIYTRTFERAHQWSDMK